MKEQKENIIRDKSYDFALKIVKIARFLCEEKKEFILSRQLLKSGTSIGANIEESVGGQSTRDFLSKISIAYKEAVETKYWLRLLVDSGTLESNQIKPLLTDCEEILRILGSIQLTLKSKIDFPHS